MIAFINEQSLREHNNWGEALRMFLKATKQLTDAGVNVFKDGNFFMSPNFKIRFNNIPNGLPPDEKALLRSLLFREHTWKCWRGSRTSSPHQDYCCQDPNSAFRDASICEATELKHQHADLASGLISAADSQFANKQQLATKKTSETNWVELRNNSSAEEVRLWLAQQKGYFDPNLNLAPRDYQTILEKEPGRFTRTGRIQFVSGKARRIYKENATSRQFYVDEWHPGGSVHMEVFDSVGNHLGEADIATGVVDLSKRDSSKRIST